MTMTSPTPVLAPGPGGGGGGGAGERGSGGRVGGRRLWAVAAIAAAVVIAVVVWAVWPTSTNRANKSIGLALPPVQPVLGAGGGELVALLQAGQRSSYHARYHLAGDPAGGVGSQDLEVWNAPPQRRVDTTQTSDGHTFRSETLTDAKSTSLCLRQDTAAWSCQSVVPQPAGGSDVIATTVRAATTGQAVAVSSTTMAGRKVRCFAIATPSGSLRICATEGGVPVVIANETVSYDLLTLDRKIPAASFKAPAAVHP